MSKSRKLNKGRKKRRKPITIAFLGIDGSGKSTHSEKIASWLQANGVKCKVIPFHKWVFADKLKNKFGKYVDVGRDEDPLKPYTPPRYSLPALIKPVISLSDNILMYYLSKWNYRDYDVIIFDRFICATAIKGKALNYNNEWLRPIWANIKPDVGIVFDSPIEKSIETINNRGDHILYTPEQLSIEREEYLRMAKKHDYPVFNTVEPFELVHDRVKRYLEKILISYGFVMGMEAEAK